MNKNNYIKNSHSIHSFYEHIILSQIREVHSAVINLNLIVFLHMLLSNLNAFLKQARAGARCHIVLLEPISLDALEKSTGGLQVLERTVCAKYG